MVLLPAYGTNVVIAKALCASKLFLKEQAGLAM